MSNKNRILITGSNGLLGQKLVHYFITHSIDFLATAKDKNKISFCPNNNFEVLDVTNDIQTQQVIANYKPTHIINTAAMTNVDACEDEVELAYAINAKGVNNILKGIQGTSTHFIQISTDFIFDGTQKTYTEEDEANPLGEYAKSKWEGEKYIFNSGYKNYTILRTSLIYGIGEALRKGNIFIWAMNQLREDKNLTIVNDQFRTPTFVDDLVQACVKSIETNSLGIFNIAGGELRSMYDFILLVADYVGKSRSLISPISTVTLNQKAPRPQSSGLIIEKAQKTFNYVPTLFQETLKTIDV